MSTLQEKKIYPFTAIVGQEAMKLGLILNIINPSLGGILIKGEKGTAKSTAVRGLVDVLHSENKRVVELPVGATEDRVVGTLDIEKAIKHGTKNFEPGILAQAHNNILYVDEVNLLDDNIVDVLLDSAAMGVNTVEREGISYSHPAKFVLVGTMNPEEGELRPQLLDRFALVVEVRGENDVALRKEIIKRRLAFESDEEAFAKAYEQQQVELKDQINNAKQLLNKVQYDEEILDVVAKIGVSLEVDGHRADIALIKTASAIAAYNNEVNVTKEHIIQAAMLVLPHRMRRMPFDDSVLNIERIREIVNE